METWRDLYDLFGKLFRPDPLADYQGPQAAQGVGMTTPDLLDLRTDPSGLSLAGRMSPLLASVLMPASAMLTLLFVTQRLRRAEPGMP